MTNAYYTFTPEFVPGTKVRAAAVNRQYTLIQQAFDLLPTSTGSLPLGTATLGTESGSGNAYVLTMPNTRTANAEGDEVVFKATHQNSGSSTMQVDAIPAVPLVRYNGDALSSGDVLVGSYYVARYSASIASFLIVSPALQTVAGAITYATPTGKAKLAASAGTATTLIRSDADIAIDQTIAPTWSGQHTFSQPLLGPAGTALLPGYSFNGDPDTGMYRTNANRLGLSVGGNLGLEIVSGTSVTSWYPNYGVDGSATAPTYSFNSGTNTGAYLVGGSGWGVSVGGTLRFDISTTAFTGTLPWRGQDGTAGAPAISFSGDTDTGVYRSGANSLDFAAGGLRIAALQTSGGVGRFYAGDGTVALPGVSFLSDAASGMYSTGVGFLAFATGGTRRMQLSSTQVYATVPFQPDDGSAGTPIFSFNSDSDTGIYRRAANAVSFTAGGTLIADVGSSGFDLQAGTLGLQDGSIATPGMHFVGDTDTGFYRVASNTIRAVGGATSSATFVPNAVYFEDGTATLPSLTFNADIDTGFYRSGANQLDFTIGGLDQHRMTTTAWIVGTQQQSIDGTGAAPVYSFVADTNTGIYRSASDRLSISAGGSSQCTIGGGALVMDNSTAIYAADGSAGSPSLTFGNDTDTGIYRFGANSLGITCGGTLAHFFSGTTLQTGTGVTTVQFTGIGTTASAANAFLDSGAGNQILRSTSSIRYKENVLSVPTKVVDKMRRLRPVTYTSNCEHDDKEKIHFGLIAEEVAEEFPELVHRNAKGEPESVQYERLGPLLLLYCRYLEDQIRAN